MGRVLLAYDPALNRNVALKLIRPEHLRGERAELRTTDARRGP